MMRNILKILTCLAIILATGTVVLLSRQENSLSTKRPERDEQVENNITINQSHYNNGTYQANGRYISPAGSEEVLITLTIEDDTITEASFEGLATHPTSRRLQDLFAEGFDNAVVGQNINQLNLTVVNGSSLTPRGFNEALEKIKTEARS